MRIAIVGAGITGLALAHTLLRRHTAASPFDVVVIERARRAGGVVRSERIEGYLCEHGPNGFLDGAPDTMTLVEELGLQNRLVASSDRAGRRFILRRGHLRPLPRGPLAFLAGDLLSPAGRLRVALEPLVPARARDDESVHTFVSRRFGREAADVIGDALTTGIYGGPSRDLSVRACLPQLWSMEHDHGSVIRGLARRRGRSAGGRQASPFGRLVSFPDGIEELPAALAQAAGDALRLGVAVDAIEHQASGAWALQLTDGSTLHADELVLATNASEAARLLEPLRPALAALLREIRSASMAVLCLGFDRAAPGAVLDGFGFLVPQGERARVLGAVWESEVFPGRAPEGQVLIRVMLGGGRDPAGPLLDEAALVAAAREDLGRICGLRAEPRFARLIRQRPGLPQYQVGHAARLARIEEHTSGLEGLHLAGNSYRGLALNACIAEARTLAARLLARNASERAARSTYNPSPPAP